MSSDCKVHTNAEDANFDRCSICAHARIAALEAQLAVEGKMREQAVEAEIIVLHRARDAEERLRELEAQRAQTAALLNAGATRIKELEAALTEITQIKPETHKPLISTLLDCKMLAAQALAPKDLKP